MLRPINLLTLLIFLAGTIFAQRQPADPSVEIAALSKQRAERAKEWLQSSNPQLIAWGAAIARQETLRELSPLLVAQAQSYPAASSIDGSYIAPADRDRHDAMFAVLDTLITLDLPLPAQISGNLYGEFPTQSLILLVRSGGETQPSILLKIFAHSRFDSPWLAAGNVLSKGPTYPSFAAEVLRNFTKHLNVTVTDNNTGIRGGIGSGCGGDVGLANKVGWPAVGAYSLRHGLDGFTGMVLLADGDEPVYYSRYESKSYGGMSGPCDNGGDRDLYRSQYLAHMAGLTSTRVSSPTGRSKDLDPHPSLWIRWSDAETYRREVLGAIVHERERTFLVIQRLHELHWLSEEEAASLQPRVDVAVWDQRHDKSTALPQVMAGDENTRFVSDFSPQR